MKLYATTTSERASKGQGGNKRLEINILAQELEGFPTRENLFNIVLEVDKNQLTAHIIDYTEGETIQLFPKHLAVPPKR